jgi:hypothetical protein
MKDFLEFIMRKMLYLFLALLFQSCIIVPPNGPSAQEAAHAASLADCTITAKLDQKPVVDEFGKNVGEANSGSINVSNCQLNCQNTAEYICQWHSNSPQQNIEVLCKHRDGDFAIRSSCAQVGLSLH